MGAAQVSRNIAGYDLVGTYLISGIKKETAWSVGASGKLLGHTIMGGYATQLKVKDKDGVDIGKPTAWIVGAPILGSKKLSCTVSYSITEAAFNVTDSLYHPYVEDFEGLGWERWLFDPDHGKTLFAAADQKVIAATGNIGPINFRYINGKENTVGVGDLGTIASASFTHQVAKGVNVDIGYAEAKDVGKSQAAAGLFGSSSGKLIYARTNLVF
jgi:hypothetical protein